MALLLSASSTARAQAQDSAPACLSLHYAFQPDCYRPDLNSACVETINRLDLGPQIAVWLEDANGGFVDTLMVTNAVATRGIGNRPGVWNFLSAPFFPYGKRQMALPIWAYARGHLYDTVMMMEPGDCAVGGPAEQCLGWHESYSTTEPYFCRPLRANEINVDAISCPTKFNSEKGLLDRGTQSYYPPRQDLITFVDRDGAGCGSPAPAAPAADPCAPRTYATLNDLDAVAAATPPYGAPYVGSWMVPDDLPGGDYVVVVEVNKEFDNNASHMHPSLADPHLDGYGLTNNFGQPSVVYRVPIHIDHGAGSAPMAAVSEIAGYSNYWRFVAGNGGIGDILPKDATISTSDPGSGEMRLLERTVAGVTGRIHVSVDACVCTHPTSVASLAISDGGLQATSVKLDFVDASADGGTVPRYDVRYREGTSMSDADFASAISGPSVPPGAPGSPNSVLIPGLKPKTQYVAGIRAVGSCNDVSPIVAVAFVTPAMNFAKVEGCFIATAAWGSALEPNVAAMRRVRDRLRPASALFALATELYYRSGPAAAAVIRRSDSARALVRRVLGPVASISELASAHAATEPTAP